MPFDGELVRFADFMDRMTAKLSKAHPRVEEVLEWAERQTEPILRSHEDAASIPSVDVPSFSGALYDVLLERTGPRLMDKRRNAGSGRGLEYWRVLKRDFGMESADAQLAKWTMYVKPARCTDVRALGEALDRWEALGREISTPMPDEIRLIALKELVPKSLLDLISTQSVLKTYA